MGLCAPKPRSARFGEEAGKACLRQADLNTGGEMDANILFGQALGLGSGWKVLKSEMDVEGRQLRLWLDFERGAQFACPECGQWCSVHDTVEKKWRHLDFWQHRKSLRKQGADIFLGALWALRGNAWSRSQEQRLQREQLCKNYPKLGRAMASRDALQDVLAGEDISSLRWWLGWACRSRLDPFRKLARTIKEHLHGVLAYMETRLTNAAIYRPSTAFSRWLREWLAAFATFIISAWPLTSKPAASTSKCLILYPLETAKRPH